MLSRALFKFLALFSVLIALSQMCLSEPIASGNELGFGFHKVKTPKGWFLYYNNENVCSLGICSVSPSGNYAIFQDATSGNVYLYRRADGRKIQLTKFGVEVPGVEKFIWYEDDDTVVWQYAEGYVRISEELSTGPVRVIVPKVLPPSDVREHR